MQKKYMSSEDIASVRWELQRVYGLPTAQLFQDRVNALGENDDLQLYSLRDDVVKSLGKDLSLLYSQSSLSAPSEPSAATTPSPGTVSTMKADKDILNKEIGKLVSAFEGTYGVDVKKIVLRGIRGHKVVATTTEF